MKTTLIISLSLLMLFTISCSDFLNEQNPNAIPSEGYFTSETDVDKAVNGIYQAIRSNNCLGETSDLYTEERSDNTGRNDNQSNAGEPFQFTDFSLLPSNTYVKSHWNSLYSAVSRTNFLLSGIDKVVFKNEDQKAIYKSEALFIRALIYFHLVRKWGDVPMVTDYLTNYNDILKNTFRVKKELVYAQIVLDLQAALNSTIPNIQPAGGKGRTCKAAINGLLGQVYLTMGTTLADNKQQNFQNAKKYLDDAYAMRTFTTLSAIPYSDVFNVDKKNSCPELIFQIVYKQGDLNYYSSVASRNQSKGETINSLKVSTGQGTFVNPDLVKEFEASDLRKDLSVKYANDPIAKAWFITKYRDTSNAAGVNGYGGNDFILMRFADIILMLAEVNLYLGNTGEAIQYLNQTRARAGLSSYAISDLDPVYHSKFPNLKLAILHERRVEFAFENQRWYDLLRFFTADELVTYFKSKNQDDYGKSNLANFGTKDIYYPIPFDEWKLDPEKMYQNLGY